MNSDHKFTWTVGCLAGLALVAASPYLLTGDAIASNLAAAGVLVAYACVLIDVVLAPLSLLEFTKTSQASQRISEVAVPAYYVALFGVVAWAVVHAPAW